MSRIVLTVLLAVLVALVAVPSPAAPTAPAAVATPAFSDFMPAEVIGARSFVQQNPALDGRGLVVAVLDTGVDPLASGLQKTSTGTVKVLEARDFTGQGDVELDEAAVQQDQGSLRASAGGLELRDLDKIGDRPVDGVWWLGAFRETQIGPAGLRDLDHDGKGDGEIALLVWRTGPGPDEVKALLDLDGNGSAAGEAVVRPYHVAQELFVPKGRQRTRDAALLSLAFEPDLGSRKAQLHFTDGSHGTHVAGIICGHKVFDQDGWHGIAPGAQILSLKIGHNALSGGATTTEAFKKALDFAGRWARVHGRPVVVNGSYGIGSAIEGQSDIDRYVDKVVRENPLLTVTFSAGNSGPGLSTVGTPAAADLALAVGAVLPKESVPTLYGGKTAQHELFAFSSRGGELNKPEVVAPGVASTSVPVWDGHEMKNGTSMASPQVAGAMLLVWAALLQDRGEEAPRALASGLLHGGLVRRALIHAARPLPGYTQLDQGHGLVDIGRAAALAKRLAKRAEAVHTLGYHLASDAPRADGAKTPGTYWRTGLFLPDGTRTVRTQVQAILPATMSADDRERFSAVYALTVDAPWLELVRDKVLLRADRPAPFEVRLRPDKLRAPGVYTARVVGREPGAAPDEAAFESWQTVVVPHRFDAANRWQQRLGDVQLDPGKVWRQFVLVPPGARHARVQVTRRDGQVAEVALAVFDPDGNRIRPRQRLVSSKHGTDAEWLADGDQLVPGTWEVTLAGLVQAAARSRVDVEIAFTGADIRDKKGLASKSGGAATASASVTNLFDEPFVGTARGLVWGVGKRDKVKAEKDRHSFPLTLGPQYAGARLVFEVDKATYNRTTDIAITVKDGSGREVAADAFGGPLAEIEWKRPAGGGDVTYTVEVEGGFTFRRKDPWSLKIEQRLRYAQPIRLEVKGPDGPELFLYPTVPVALQAKAADALPAAPDGWEHGAEVELWSADGRRRWLVVPFGEW